MTSEPTLFHLFDEQSVTETHTLTFDCETGWSQPFPDVDSENTLLVVFAADEFRSNAEPLRELAAAFPTSKLVGCGTVATMSNGDLLESGISVGIMKFKSTQIRIVTEPVASFDESFSVGVSIGNQLSDVNLKGVLVFSDGVTTEATDLVRGLQETMLPGVTIAGGLASGDTLESSWVFVDGEPKPFHACAVGLIGSRVELVPASGGGWKLIGAERQATRASGKTLFELNGQPASEVYKQHIGPEAVAQLPESAIRFPIAVKVSGLETQVVRDVYRLDEETGALILAGDIPEGVMVQFMTTTCDEIVDGVDEAVTRLRNKTIMPHDNVLCICVSCAGRRAVLLEDTYEEAQLTYEEIGKGISHVGMYAAGEISTTSDGAPQVHNQTITMTLIREY